MPPEHDRLGGFFYFYAFRQRGRNRNTQAGDGPKTEVTCDEQGYSRATRSLKKRGWH